MKVHVKLDTGKMKVDESFTGANADEIVGKMKARVAKELPFAMRLAVNAMNTKTFCQEVVKRANASQKTDLPIPETADQFLQIAVKQGYATIEE